MLSVIYKTVPTCVFAQGPCQLAAEMAPRLRPHEDAIGRVTIHMPEAAARYPGCDNPGPISSRLAAQASVQFSVAVVLAAGSGEPDWNNFRDPLATRIASVSEIVIDPALTRAFPSRNGTRLDVYLADGSVQSVAQDNVRPMTVDEIIRRFMQQAEAKVGATRAKAAYEAFANLAYDGDITLGLRALSETGGGSLKATGACG